MGDGMFVTPWYLCEECAVPHRMGPWSFDCEADPLAWKPRAADGSRPASEVCVHFRQMENTKEEE